MNRTHQLTHCMLFAIILFSNVPQQLWDSLSPEGKEEYCNEVANQYLKKNSSCVELDLWAERNRNTGVITIKGECTKFRPTTPEKKLTTF